MHDLTSMFEGVVLDAYATGKYYLTEIWDTTYSWLEDGFDRTLDWFEDMADAFWEAIEDLFVSDSSQEAAENEQEARDYTALSPIAIDLDGDGLHTIGIGSSNVLFDLNGDGNVEKTAWLNPNDGFLVIDSNNDGQINDINEMFGGDKRGEGYAKLQLMDTNRDGVISSTDEAFNDLLIWQDANSNGVTDDGELATLGEANIDTISVDYLSWDQYDHGNLIGEHSWARVNDSLTIVGDIYFMAEVEAA